MIYADLILSIFIPADAGIRIQMITRPSAATFIKIAGFRPAAG